MAKLFRGKNRALLLAALAKQTVTLPQACGLKVLDDLRRVLLATNQMVHA